MILLVLLLLPFSLFCADADQELYRKLCDPRSTRDTAIVVAPVNADLENQMQETVARFLIDPCAPVKSEEIFTFYDAFQKYREPLEGLMKKEKLHKEDKSVFKDYWLAAGMMTGGFEQQKFSFLKSLNNDALKDLARQVSWVQRVKSKQSNQQDRERSHALNVFLMAVGVLREKYDRALNTLNK